MPKNPNIPMPKGAPAPSADTPKANTPAGLPQNTAAAEDVFEEDFTDVQGGFPMADEGLHHAKVIDFERAESKSGNPQYVWQFRITAGNNKDMELRFWTSLLPQARWKTAEALDAIGIAAAGSIAKFRKSDVLGRPCIIEVAHETYDNRLQHKVQRVHPPNEDSVKLAKGDTTPF